MNDVAKPLFWYFVPLLFLRQIFEARIMLSNEGFDLLNTEGFILRYSEMLNIISWYVLSSPRNEVLKKTAKG